MIFFQLPLATFQWVTLLLFGSLVSARLLLPRLTEQINPEESAADNLNIPGKSTTNKTTTKDLSKSPTIDYAYATTPSDDMKTSTRRTMSTTIIKMMTSAPGLTTVATTTGRHPEDGRYKRDKKPPPNLFKKGKYTMYDVYMNDYIFGVVAHCTEVVNHYANFGYGNVTDCMKNKQGAIIYRIEDTKTWDEASTACQLLPDTHLMSVHNFVDFVIGHKLMHTVKQRKKLKTGTWETCHWIGLKRPEKSCKKPFVHSDGTPVEYVKWRRDEPDCNGGIEFCTSISKDNSSKTYPDAGWNDVSCYNHCYPICRLNPKKKLVGSVSVDPKAFSSFGFKIFLFLLYFAGKIC